MPLVEVPSVTVEVTLPGVMPLVEVVQSFQDQSSSEQTNGEIRFSTPSLSPQERFSLGVTLASLPDPIVRKRAALAKRGGAAEAEVIGCTPGGFREAGAEGR
jgi:hypothetical protein